MSQEFLDEDRFILTEKEDQELRVLGLLCVHDDRIKDFQQKIKQGWAHLRSWKTSATY